jgi:hypothetical protein
LVASGIRAALDNFDFEVLCKIDTDALLTGAGLPARALEAWADDPRGGLLGSVGVRPDGTAEDYGYDAWVLRSERRWSRRVRKLHDAARAGGYDGSKAHGGVYLLSRPAIERIASAGWLDWRPPAWTLLNEDTCVGLVTRASGLRPASFGGPGQPLASISHKLPLPKEEVRAQGRLAVHSVRRGTAGESEEEIRAYFRALRAKPL